MFGEAVFDVVVSLAGFNGALVEAVVVLAEVVSNFTFFNSSTEFN